MGCRGGGGGGSDSFRDRSEGGDSFQGRGEEGGGASRADSIQSRGDPYPEKSASGHLYPKNGGDSQEESGKSWDSQGDSLRGVHPMGLADSSLDSLAEPEGASGSTKPDGAVNAPDATSGFNAAVPNEMGATWKGGAPNARGMAEASEQFRPDGAGGANRSPDARGGVDWSGDSVVGPAGLGEKFSQLRCGQNALGFRICYRLLKIVGVRSNRCDFP